MAEAAVSFLLEETSEWLTKELSLPGNIRAGIKDLKKELEWILHSLKHMDAQNGRFYPRIKELQDVAYDIEVLLDMYAYQKAEEDVRWLVKMSGHIRNHSISALVKEIQANLKSSQDRSNNYGMSSPPHPASSSYQEAGLDPLYAPAAEIVGFDEPTRELVRWVRGEENEYKAIFVVGMGGSGKTALVKLVYDQVMNEFGNCHVWLTVPQYQFDRTNQILSAIFNKLTGLENPSTFFDKRRDITDMLRNYLQSRRYLIVLDDLREEDIWKAVARALPKANYSRVIITTRRGDIASSSRGGQNFVDVYNVQALPRREAQELFNRKVFGKPDMDLPPALSESYEKLLEDTEGLPLGIIEIGKLLSNKEKSVLELTKLHDSLQDELASGQLSSTSKLLFSSYNELPYHLKYCFLYMTMFRDGYSVKRRTLIRLWMAEGLINEVNGKTLEDIGEEYLKQLMERNLIQASELDFEGKPRACRLHSLMHKIALSESKAVRFCTISGGILDKTRRLSIQKNEFNIPKEILEGAHALITSSSNLTIPKGTIFSSFFSSMKLLKILHLDNANVDELPSESIEKLFLLKYLCLSNTSIKLIPKAIKRLQLLETLNLKRTCVTSLPKGLKTLKKLRHLLVYRYNIKSYLDFDAVQGSNVQTGISNLTNLQKLSFVKADRDGELIRELQNLTQLRKLGIIDLPSNSGEILCATIQMLTNLRSLSMRSQSTNEVLNIQGIKSPPPCLRRLYLWGRLENMPEWISKLTDLVRIRLKWSRLTHQNNPITILGELPNLLELQLLDAYTGDQLDFDAGTFPKLKILELERLENLKFVVIDNGALPCLQKLIIRKCRKLLQIPVGIDNVTQLKELDLSDMPPDFVGPLRRNGQMRHLVQHIQNIISRRLQNDHRWVSEDLSQNGKQKDMDRRKEKVQPSI